MTCKEIRGQPRIIRSVTSSSKTGSIREEESSRIDSSREHQPRQSINCFSHILITPSLISSISSLPLTQVPLLVVKNGQLTLLNGSLREGYIKLSLFTPTSNPLVGPIRPKLLCNLSIHSLLLVLLANYSKGSLDTLIPKLFIHFLNKRYLRLRPINYPLS
jgi:hypothetical protein